MSAGTDLAQNVQAVLAGRLQAQSDLARLLRNASVAELRTTHEALGELAALVAGELARRTIDGGERG